MKTLTNKFVYFHKNPKFCISKSRVHASQIGAKISLKRGQPLLQWILRSLYTMGGSVTPNWVKQSHSYLRKLNLLKKKQGSQGLVKYLKVASVITQQVCSGYVLSDLTPLGMRISRSKSGLPRMIPAQQRKLIMQGSRLHTKFWLTLFSIYRDIHFDGVLKIQSIIGASTASSDALSVLGHVKSFTTLYWKDHDTKWGVGAFGVFQILTSGPQVIAQLKGKRTLEFNTHLNSVIRSLRLFLRHENAPLLEALMKILAITGNEPVKNLFSRLSFREGDKLISPFIKTRGQYLGALAVKEEAAGKVRVFAMVDPWTQWALRPLHKALFRVLSRMVTDGTFNQLEPLKRVPFGQKPIYSFDLSSATDRLPVWLQESILSEVYGKEFSHAWKQLLVGRAYTTPVPRIGSTWKLPGKIPSQVFYAVGQPMGALSSWAMLAITHHYIVHYCA